MARAEAASAPRFDTVSSGTRSEAESPNRRHRWRVFGFAWAVLAILTVLWSIATPIAAAPDEPAHLVKAASVARGQFIGETGELGQVVQVPRYVAFTHSQTCTAFTTELTAACAADVPGDPSELVDASTTAGLYNPVYYVLIGWPSIVFDDQAGIFAMRAMSGIVTSLLLAGVVALVSTWPRRALPVVGLAFAVTPMVFFLDAVVNPNGLEVVSTLAVFVAMLSIVRYPDARLLTERALFVAVAGALAANARGLSLVWLAMAVLVPLLLIRKEQWREIFSSTAVRATVGIVGLAAAAGAFWVLFSNSLGAAIDEPDSAYAAPSIGASPVVGFTYVFQRTFDFAQGMVGVFGWLDTGLPLSIYGSWTIALGAMLVIAVVTLSGRRLVVALVLLGCVVVVPGLLQAAYVSGGGLIWQGRYTLPAFVCLAVGLGALLSERFPDLDPLIRRRVVIVAASVWGASQFYAFLTALRRYAVAADGTWVEMFTASPWQPPLGIIPIVGLFAVGSLLATLGFVALTSERRLESLGSRAMTPLR